MKSQIDKKQEFLELQSTFHSKFDILKKAKNSLFKLFREKLEEKKIEEIKHGVLDKN